MLTFIEGCHREAFSAYTEARRLIALLIIIIITPQCGELRTQKLKSHLVSTQSLNVLPLKPGVGQYIAIHATLTASGLFLAYFLPFRSNHLQNFQSLSRVFPVVAVACTGFCVGPQNKVGHPAGCRFRC